MSSNLKGKARLLKFMNMEATNPEAVNKEVPDEQKRPIRELTAKEKSRRRERNKKASRNYRKRVRDKETQLKETFVEEVYKNLELKRRVAELEEEYAIYAKAFDLPLKYTDYPEKIRRQYPDIDKWVRLHLHEYNMEYKPENLIK